ncbi:hypothetical protein PMAYCL1PPCAC_08622, partial [Pristionchus mayeri]
KLTEHGAPLSAHPPKFVQSLARTPSRIGSVRRRKMVENVVEAEVKNIFDILQSMVEIDVNPQTIRRKIASLESDSGDNQDKSVSPLRDLICGLNESLGTAVDWLCDIDEYRANENAIKK